MNKIKCRHGYENYINHCPGCHEGICDIDDVKCNAIVKKDNKPDSDFQKIQQKYYESREICNDNFGGQIEEIENYVNALEEREKRMLDFIINLYRVYPYDSNNLEQKIDKSLIKDLIESITGQSIEEVLKK